MALSKNDSFGVDMPRGHLINGRLAKDTSTGSNFAYDLQAYWSDQWGTRFGEAIPQKIFPYNVAYDLTNRTTSPVTNEYYTYGVSQVHTNAPDSILFSLGATNDDITETVWNGGNHGRVSSADSSNYVECTFGNVWPRYFELLFNVSASPKGTLAAGERSLFGDRSLGANNTYVPAGPSMSWTVFRSANFVETKADADNRITDPSDRGMVREIAVAYDSDETNEMVLFFYSSDEKGYRWDTGAYHDGWFGNFAVNNDVEVIWRIDITYDANDRNTVGAAIFTESLSLDGSVVYSRVLNDIEGWDQYDLLNRSDSGFVGSTRADDYKRQPILGGEQIFATQGSNSDMRAGNPYPDFANGSGMELKVDLDDPESVTTSNVYDPMSQADTPAGSPVFDGSYGGREASEPPSVHLPPIDWYFGHFGASTNAQPVASWMGNGSFGQYNLPSTKALLEVAITNIEYGCGGTNSIPTGHFLGQPALASGYDFVFPSGNHLDLDFRDRVERVALDILHYSSMRPKTSRGVVRHQNVPRTPANLSTPILFTTTEPYFEFGIEAGGLPTNFYTENGKIAALVADVNTPSNLTGTVQFYGRGLDNVKVLSPVYSWTTEGDLFVYWDNPVHSSTPLAGAPEAKSADAIWVVGDAGMVMGANVSGGTPPYNLLLPNVDYGSSRQRQTKRLTYDSANGDVTLPSNINNTSEDFVSTRGVVSLTDCIVSDAAGDSYDDRKGYRLQVRYPTPRAEWHESGAFPWASGDSCVRDFNYRYDDYYTPDSSYDLTFYSDMIDYFGFYGVDVGEDGGWLVRGGVADVTTGSVPSGVMRGYSEFYDFFYGYGNDWYQGSNSQIIQSGVHTEAHNTTGSFVLRITTPFGNEVFSRTHTWICKTDGDYCTYEYQDPTTHPNATADPNYDHVWADGSWVMLIDPSSTPDRYYAARFVLAAGDLPEGVELNEADGTLTMDGSVLGGEDTGSYTIAMLTSDRGFREKTYTWKREGTPPI